MVRDHLTTPQTSPQGCWRKCLEVVEEALPASAIGTAVAALYGMHSSESTTTIWTWIVVGIALLGPSAYFARFGRGRLLRRHWEAGLASTAGRIVAFALPGATVAGIIGAYAGAGLMGEVIPGTAGLLVGLFAGYAVICGLACFGAALLAQSFASRPAGPL